MRHLPSTPGATAALLAALLAFATPAFSHDAGTPSMFFGLFTKRYPSSVNPQLGAALKRETAMPADLPAPTAPAQLPWRRVDGSPPGGAVSRTLSTDPTENRAAVRDGIAVVNRTGDEHRATLWQVDAGDPARFLRPLNSAFEPDMSRWVTSHAPRVLPLPAGRLLVQLSYHRPQATEGLYLYDPATDRLTSLGRIEPGWGEGTPFSYVKHLALSPDAVLVIHHTDQERLAAERYVTHHDHLVLYSTRYPDGLPIATVGIDDGKVVGWGLAGRTLWLRTADFRVRPAREFVWSLDLARVL